VNNEADNREEAKDRTLSEGGVDRAVESVKWFILSEELIPKESLVLAAVSGGQDSMALLSILHRLRGELGFGLIAAHFDHNLRPSSKIDREVVERFAKSFPVELIVGSANVRELADQSGDNIEETARKARYEFLLRSAEEAGASLIATGHTKDDQIETVVMHLLRGCGIRGLAGIPVRRGRLIRPLLAMRREETAAYCKACGIFAAVDPTNEDRRYFRNRIRLEVLPFLRNIEASVDEHILRLSENARKLIVSTRVKTDPLLKRHSRKLSDHQWKVNAAKLSDLDDTSLVVLFGDLFTEHMGLDRDFTQPHFEQLIRLARTASASGKKLSLPNLEVKREFENLILTIEPSAIPHSTEAPIHISLDTPGRASVGGMTIQAEIAEKDSLPDRSYEAGENAAYFALDAIAPPLIIRHPKPGDRMQPFGMKGTKKLSDIFIDKKIPGSERTGRLVVSDSQGILWLIGVVTSERGRIEEKTQKILKITVRQE